MTESGAAAEQAAQIIEQSDDVRDPADDSDEMDDPTEMANTYPGTFPTVEEANRAIREHEATNDPVYVRGDADRSTLNDPKDPAPRP